MRRCSSATRSGSTSSIPGTSSVIGLSTCSRTSSRWSTGSPRLALFQPRMRGKPSRAGTGLRRERTCWPTHSLFVMPCATWPSRSHRDPGCARGAWPRSPLMVQLRRANQRLPSMPRHRAMQRTPSMSRQTRWRWRRPPSMAFSARMSATMSSCSCLIALIPPHPSRGMREGPTLTPCACLLRWPTRPASCSAALAIHHGCGAAGTPGACSTSTTPPRIAAGASAAPRDAAIASRLPHDIDAPERRRRWIQLSESGPHQGSAGSRRMLLYGLARGRSSARVSPPCPLVVVSRMASRPTQRNES